MANKNIKTKKVLLRGCEIEYTLERKSVKNVNLRVRPDGSVYVSANRGVNEKYIEKFLMEKGDFILDAIERYRRLADAAPPANGCFDGDTVTLLGREYRICGVMGVKNLAEIRGNALILILLKDTEEQRVRLVEDFRRELCRRVVTELCREEFSRFEALDVRYPEIKFRRMKSRWGSCQPKKGILTFNYELAAVPIECVRYVVLHEFTHFLHPDHSAAFHRRLASFMPEAAERRRQLEAYGVRLRIEK